MNWAEPKVVNYILHINTHHHTKKLSMTTDRACLVHSYSLHILSSQQRNPHCNSTYKIFSSTKKHPAAAYQTFSMSLSIQLKLCSVLFWNSWAQSSKLWETALFRAAPREDMPLGDKRGIWVPWNTPAFATGVLSARVNRADIWHLANAKETSFWSLLNTITTLANSLP